jgi:hypothetical protein
VQILDVHTTMQIAEQRRELLARDFAATAARQSSAMRRRRRHRRLFAALRPRSA